MPSRGHVPDLPGMTRTVRYMGCFGPLARSVDDLETALRVIAGPDGYEAEAPPVPLGPTPKLSAKGLQTIPANDVLVVESPGGGGLGDPLTRPAEAVHADVVAGYCSLVEARTAYGVVVNDDLSLDQASTAILRRRRQRQAPQDGIVPVTM